MCYTCTGNVSCLDCKFKLNQWTIEALQLKQDLLNNARTGITDSGQLHAYIAATFTVLDLLDRKEAA